jgi:adenylosuccinate synthase
MTARITVDLGFGDAGKGSIVEYLAGADAAALVVRFNGGAQASHNVVLANGRHHTFRQFGSASLLGVPTYLSRHVIVEPALLLEEAEALEGLGVPDPLRLLKLDSGALVVTPAHIMLNQVKERARGDARHGSCGLGIGETRRFHVMYGDEALFVGDLRDAALTRAKSNAIAQRLLDEAHAIDPTIRMRDQAVQARMEAFRQVGERVTLTGTAPLRAALGSGRDVIFEAAQGVLLDETWGFYPHTTWTDTTTHNALALLDEVGYHGPREVIGIIRSYMTRHGAGPLVTEDPALRYPEPHNGAYEWAGGFRRGHPDLVALKYALRATGGVDRLVVTHVDRLPEDEVFVCTEYRTASGTAYMLPADRPSVEQMGSVTHDLRGVRPVYQRVPSRTFLDLLEAVTGVPLALTSHGPLAADKRVTSRRLAIDGAIADRSALHGQLRRELSCVAPGGASGTSSNRSSGIHALARGAGKGLDEVRIDVPILPGSGIRLFENLRQRTHWARANESDAVERRDPTSGTEFCG